jgi:hypothetical protein
MTAIATIAKSLAWRCMGKLLFRASGTAEAHGLTRSCRTEPGLRAVDCVCLMSINAPTERANPPNALTFAAIAECRDKNSVKEAAQRRELAKNAKAES